MKIKSQLTLAALIVAGMFATGCQQMQQTAGGSQQTAGGSQQTAETTETTETTTTTTTGDANTHTHADAPACATKTHSHPGANPGHTHVYGCVAGQRPMVPKVKAKGNYKGAVMMDDASKAAMQQYQQ